MTSGAATFSLVIPARNEEAYLPRLLETVQEARSRYVRAGKAVEVIVADNASTDSTAKVAAEHGCRVVRVEKRVIAAVRNGGAAIAEGEVLAFVDADTRIHPETFNAIDRALAGGRVIGGATGVTLERWSLGLAATYLFIMPIVVLTGMDTGVVFCRREDFGELGGYDERRLVAEDAAFLWRLKKLGRERGQKLARVAEAKAIVSTRKFDEHGDWHWFTQLIPRALPALLSASAERRLAEKYWYGRLP